MTEVAKICNKNLQKMNVKNGRILNKDIREIYKEILDKINVFYLFNPFLNYKFLGFITYVNAACENKFLKYQNILALTKMLEDFTKINYYCHTKYEAI